MSVPTWKRQLSNAEYVYKTYVLNIELGRIFANKPKKYKSNYTDKIIQSALTALECLQTVDSIYLTRYSIESDFILRRNNLSKARGIIQHIATASYIFLEIVRKHDCEGEKHEMQKKDKIYKQELYIGTLCEECFKLISGVMKSDMELYKKYIKPKTSGQ